ncbi:MAG: hypothetical protein EXX96DRAFT_653426 [Benjaminiella poitrasii]|nr:MAG: hypothetical protein EXX96DRAFT_653426 [Benjaminiella poitrasii]
MRSSIALTLAVAAVAVSAQDCNPSYNVATSGTCFTNCNVQAGQKYVPGWTMDHASSVFLDSLKLMCTKGTSEYLAFMTEAGMCMAGCPDDPTLFVDEFAGACAWYAEHKDDTCAGSSESSSSSAADVVTTTTAAATTADTGVTTSTADVATPTASTVDPVATALNGTSVTVPATALLNTTAAVNASSVIPSASITKATVPNPSTVISADDTSAASTLQISGLTLALIAGVSYLTL